MLLNRSCMTLGIYLFAMLLFVGAEQMCYLCHYGTGLKRECIRDPQAWQGDEHRVRCAHDCVVNAIYDESGYPTYVYRGCHRARRQEGCVTEGNTHNCFYSCKGTDFCNEQDMGRSPLLGSDGASGLTPLSPLGLLLSTWSLGAVVLVRIAMKRLYG